jgi:processive 1,2-diacylglycerol beta-glucosyltransferase
MEADMKTLLILHAACGAGHRRAAEALAAAAAGEPGLRVVVRDALGFTPGFHRHVYARGYASLVRRAPGLWGLLYAATDGGGARGGLRRLLALQDRLAAGRGLSRYVEALAPDAVIATHFLPAALLADGAAGGRRRAAPAHPPLTCVVTDYRAHSVWVSPRVAAYAAASEEAAADLEGRGVPRRLLETTGLPVHPAFARLAGRRAARRDGIPRRLLVLTGGAGIGAIEAFAETITAALPDLDVTVSAGDNRALAVRLTARAARSRGRVTVVGMVRDVERLFEETDLLLTKPGGLTVTEAAVAGIPMLLYPGIPGQEEGNAALFVRRGAARFARTPEDAVREIRRLRDDPIARTVMRRAQGRLCRPDAAARILALCGALPAAAAGCGPGPDAATNPPVAAGAGRAAGGAP